MSKGAGCRVLGVEDTVEITIKTTTLTSMVRHNRRLKSGTFLFFPSLLLLLF